MISTKRMMQYLMLLLAIASCQSCDSCGKSGPQWGSLGPWSVEHMSNNVVAAGRVDDIQIAYNYDGKGGAAMFLATPGGLWRSTDFLGANPTWVPLTDHISNIPDARRVGINSRLLISIDPNNPKNIWATSGGGPLALLHSADGGDSWSLVAQGQFDASGSLNRVLIDPYGFIWVATNNAFYVSENKGASFIRIDSGQPGKEYQDISWYSPQKGRFNVYVALVDRDKTNNQSGIWTVSGVNGAFKWTMIPINLENLYGFPIDSQMINSIRLYADENGAVASLAQAGDLVCPDPTKSIWGLLNVFELDGNTWQPKWKLGPNDVGSEVQQGYVQPICITSDHRIYAGGKGIGVSDGQGGVLPIGGTKSSLQNCQIQNESAIPDKNGKTIHVDVHAVRYCALDKKIYVATDGGMVRFMPDFGIPGLVDAWESLNTPSLDNFLSESVAANTVNVDNVLAGHQDNGVIHFGNKRWDFVGGGESDYVFFDPFGTAYYIDCSGGCGDAPLSTDGGNTFSQSMQFPDPDNNFGLSFHPTQQNRMMIPTHDGKRQTGQFTVYETRDGWKNVNAVRNLNPPVDNYPNAMTYAGENIYVCKDKDVYLSTDDGASWTKIWTAGDSIVSIFPDAGNSNAIYLATQLWHSGKIYFNPDPVKNPTDFREIGTLQAEVKKMVLYSKGAGKDPLLYVATSQGVYRATAINGTNTNWSLYGSGLPDVDITDLQINTKSHWLLVATWGRGVWYIIDTDQL